MDQIENLATTQEQYLEAVSNIKYLLSGMRNSYISSADQWKELSPNVSLMEAIKADILNDLVAALDHYEMSIKYAAPPAEEIVPWDDEIVLTEE